MSNRRRGFISINTLVAFIVTLSIIPLAVSVISSVANINISYTEVNDELALLDLRRKLLIAYDVKNNGNSLSFIYDNDDFELSLINNRLVLTPGYQMFLDDIDYIEFVEEGNSIYIRYGRKNKEYKTPIIKQKGIYLDEFSDYDDEYD